MKKFMNLLEEMEQHKKDGSIQQESSNDAHPCEAQNNCHDISPIQNTDIEGNEKSGITDCWYIPQNDTRTINQNIKTRNR